MISKKYMPNPIDPSRQHAENVERVQQKRQWTENPALMEIVTADDVNYPGSLPPL